MKRKIAALLATVLVMTMGATTVFAAVSPTVTDKTDTKPTVTSEAGTVAVTAVDEAVVTEQAAAAEAKKVVEAEKAESAEIAVLADISVPGANPTEAAPVVVKIAVPSVDANTKVKVLNFNGTTSKWDECKVASVENGYVSAEFTHFSPVMVITYTVATTTVTPPATTTDETPASPKTGVLPVAAIAAGICLAGAAVCGKKVKFN